MSKKNKNNKEAKGKTPVTTVINEPANIEGEEKAVKTTEGDKDASTDGDNVTTALPDTNEPSSDEELQDTEETLPEETLTELELVEVELDALEAIEEEEMDAIIEKEEKAVLVQPVDTKHLDDIFAKLADSIGVFPNDKSLTSPSTKTAAYRVDDAITAIGNLDWADFNFNWQKFLEVMRENSKVGHAFSLGRLTTSSINWDRGVVSKNNFTNLLIFIGDGFNGNTTSTVDSLFLFTELNDKLKNNLGLFYR